MTATGSSPAFDGMYSQLIEDEGTYDELHPHPVSRVMLPSRLSGSGPYRLTTICLATLCAILLISIIAVTAHCEYTTVEKCLDECLVPPPKVHHSDTKSLSRRTKTSHCRETRLSDSETNKLTRMNIFKYFFSRCEKCQPQNNIYKIVNILYLFILYKNLYLVIKPTEAAIVCPVDWQLFNNSCYFISRVQRDWAESRSYCQSKGAHLAIIHTAEEQTFLWNLLPRGHWNAYWFGITDAQTEDQWKWVDGTPLVGGFWEVGEPNNHINEDCGYIVKTRVLTRVPIRSWYDAPCTMALPYICEKEMSAGASTAIPH
uniref:C-type lectin domain family 4 member E-like n=1 Tax=Seriola lalandi dorsalis TaxID=1841481 RepID=A0A3B4Y1G5_SERLL